MSNMRTMRVTEFKGLNKSSNPHNIDDKEFVEMENLLLTKNNSLVSRKGYTHIGDIADTNFVRSVWNTAWTYNSETLYYLDKYNFGKMVDGTATKISSLAGSGPAKAIRYKDKMLLLANESSSYGGYLKWYDSDEELSSIEYPEFQAWALGGLSESSGDLDADSDVLREGFAYEYNMACELGEVQSDGITALAKPSTWSVPAYDQVEITTATEHIEGSVRFSCGNLHGMDITRLNLYRREIETYSDGTRRLGSWVLIDTVGLEKIDSAGTIIYRKVSITSDPRDVTTKGVITNLSNGSSYSPTQDNVTIVIEMTDIGSKDYYEETSYEAAEIIHPKAKYVARLHSRIFLANITSSDPTDKKRVRYSYRPLAPDAAESEIPGVYYDEPMLIFPYNNYFDCDAEDIEDEITGIETFENNVIVFTQRCTFLWREGMAEPMKISNDVGCIAWDSIKEFEGSLVWLAHNGVYRFDGSKLINLTYEKMEPYIDDMRNDNAKSASAVIFDRKYYLAAPFESTLSDLFIVYDFDLKTWHVRRYKAPNASTMYTDSMFVDYDGANATLYFAGKNADAECFIGQLENGYVDDTNSITCPFKMKYYDFKAPEINKMPRVFYIDAESVYGGIAAEVYIDNLDTATASFTIAPTITNALVSNTDNLQSVIAGSDLVDTTGFYYAINLSDALAAVSLGRGLVGARVQFGATLTARAAELKIHMIGFEWTDRGKIKRRYGA